MCASYSKIDHDYLWFVFCSLLCAAYRIVSVTSWFDKVYWFSNIVQSVAVIPVPTSNTHLQPNFPPLHHIMDHTSWKISHSTTSRIIFCPVFSFPHCFLEFFSQFFPSNINIIGSSKGHHLPLSCPPIVCCSFIPRLVSSLSHAAYNFTLKIEMVGPTKLYCIKSCKTNFFSHYHENQISQVFYYSKHSLS